MVFQLRQPRLSRHLNQQRLPKQHIGDADHGCWIGTDCVMHLWMNVSKLYVSTDSHNSRVAPKMSVVIPD
jgi:hypothetical protein